MNYPQVSIIILNWNGLEDTVECLQSLKGITYPNYNVIVVDNGSVGGDVEGLRTKFKDYIHIIANDKNYGFTGGNNIGMRYALKNCKPESFLLLNNDTVVDSDFLTELVSASEENPSVGIAGPKTYLFDDPHRFQLVWLKINMLKGKGNHVGSRELDRGQYESVREVDCVQGSCFFIKQAVIEKIGLLDEGYVNYWDEPDYCARARKAGYRIVYCPRARIWHKISRTAEKVSGLFQFYNTRNRFWFMKKYATRKQLAFFICWFFLYELWLQSGILLLYHKNLKALVSLYRGTIEGLRKPGNRTLKRKNYQSVRSD